MCLLTVWQTTKIRAGTPGARRADSSESEETSSSSQSAENPKKGAVAEQQFLYIQMEYCPRTLREALDDTSRTLEVADFWEWLRQVSAPMHYAHFLQSQRCSDAHESLELRPSSCLYLLSLGFWVTLAP